MMIGALGWCKMNGSCFLVLCGFVLHGDVDLFIIESGVTV